jgi:predicted Zn-dependent peptidase
MDRELSRIRNHGLRDAEIERARTWLIQQIQYEKTDPASVADAVLQQALGRESAGLDERIQAIQQISNADIQRVSHRWLVPERLILSVLPEEEQGRAPRGSHWIMSL